MQIATRPVSASQLAALTTSLRHSTTDPHAGLFGPDSLSWRINRESILFLGAGRASLLQLAHPWVAAALEHHSSLRTDPLARFHHTFRIVFTMVFGTLDQAISASRYLHRRHGAVRGKLPQPVAGWPQYSPYQANELNALIWVFATLVDSAVVAYDAVLEPLQPAESQAYYDECKRLAALFGIPSDALPSDWSSLQAYLQSTLDSPHIGVDDLARDLADGVLHGRGTWIPVTGWYRALTAQWLPDPLRVAFALPFGPDEQSAATRALDRIRSLYPQLPRPVRFVGPYREALARLAGRRPGPLVRASNRFWIGNSLTMFRPDAP